MSPRLAIFAGAVFATAALPAAFAQAPAGPIRAQPSRASSSSPAERTKEQRTLPAPLAPARQTIAGAWKLNHTESDDVRMKFRAAYRDRAEENRRQRDPWGGGSRGPYGNGPYGRKPTGRGDPWPGGGGWGYPEDPHGNRGDINEPREDDLEGLEEFIFPPEAVTLALENPQIVLTDDDGRKRVFFTDDRK